MTFQIHALPAEPFQDLFHMPDDTLRQHRACRVTADAAPGYPCRVSLEDAKVGEELLLVNYQHLTGASPYAASHAIYVRKGVQQAYPAPDQVPQVLSRRLLSVRGFDAQGLMQDADVVDGMVLDTKLDQMFGNPAISFIDIHNAKQGCFAAKATRA